MSDVTVAERTQVVEHKNIFGFWLYIMTDCILFATLFATYAVLRNNTYGGPSGHELFSMPYVLIETLLLLSSSFTCGMMVLAARKRHMTQLWLWLGTTFLLGLAFVTMELTEFTHLVADGNSWQRSAFLSAFFTLVGTHGGHITVGLIWMLIMGSGLLSRGLTATAARRLSMFSIFWHFLDVVWVCIFTIVYLMGVA